ncbi:hypothetical protein QJS10_CPB13g00615 [Acorus calamus]|uniref:Uncharacterized protein n=1 Tax=Acorus calamus TaxID=4465 RepID=A0AAV9DL71_ACOCL|nr:hypothetical protein QJS10_CPB13g00615 [Acorus calamus]
MQISGLVDRAEARIDWNTPHKVAQARSIVEDDIENKCKHGEVVTEINQSSASSIQPEESTLESQAAATHVQSPSPSMPLYLDHGSFLKRPVGSGRAHQCLFLELEMYTRCYKKRILDLNNVNGKRYGTFLLFPE